MLAIAISAPSLILIRINGHYYGVILEGAADKPVEHRVQGIPAFRDFTIRDPHFFVILFQASIW